MVDQHSGCVKILVSSLYFTLSPWHFHLNPTTIILSFLATHYRKLERWLWRFTSVAQDTLKTPWRVMGWWRRRLKQWIWLVREEDHTTTANSRQAALARLWVPGHLPLLPHSPTSFFFSVQSTIRTYSSTSHLRPTSAFALISPSLGRKGKDVARGKIEDQKTSSRLRVGWNSLTGEAFFFGFWFNRLCVHQNWTMGERVDLTFLFMNTCVCCCRNFDWASNGLVFVPLDRTKGAALLSRIGVLNNGA